MQDRTSQGTAQFTWLQRVQNALTLALCVAGLLSVTACATTGGAGGEGFNSYTTDRTPLNEFGPNQTEPPASYLEAGERVRILAQAGAGYVLVETKNGARGYVPKSVVQERELIQ